MTAPPVPDDVQAATRQHLHALDAAASGLVAALYVTGSVALGDYQQGRSDIDFMAFLSRPVTDPQTVGWLAEVHAGLAGPADYDGNYVALACVPGVPDDEPSAPHVVSGQFRGDEPNHQLTPATWAEFASYGIAIRGPRPAEFGIQVSRDRLSEWTLGNLNTHWKHQAEEGIETLRAHDSATSISAEAVAWMALGPARLHYTLATGDIASKTAAGEYAAGMFPAYQPFLSAAMTWRATGRGDFTYGDWVACAELTLHIVADANRRWGNRNQP
jgi:Nucleotidyltransferase domain